MADETTKIKLFRCAPRKRLTVQDAEDFTNLAADLIENNVWAESCDLVSCVMYGWVVTHNADKRFNLSAGCGLQAGKLVKTIAAIVDAVELEDNPAGGGTRIDTISIASTKDVAGDPDNIVLLSPIIRTDVLAFPMGMGTGIKKRFDLGHNGVDIRTLKVRMNAVPVGGWNLSPETGTAGVDEVIFWEAPGNLDTLESDYTHQTGGFEATSAGIPTRYSREANKVAPSSFEVTKGVGGFPVLPAAGNIMLAYVYLPDGWAGGAPDRISNQVKRFPIFPDNENLDVLDSMAIAPNANRLYSPISGMNQVLHGMRLKYIAADEITVTPGWGSSRGVAFHMEEDLTGVPAAYSPIVWNMTAIVGGVPAINTWYYIYAWPKATTASPPGSLADIYASTTPPSHRRTRGSIDEGVYLGAVRTDGAGNLTPFYTHGAWTFWQAPIGHTLNIATGVPTDVDISQRVPVTGRLISGKAIVQIQSAAAGDWAQLVMGSHRAVTALTNPNITMRTEYALGAAAVIDRHQTFFLRAEDFGGNRWVYYALLPGAIGIAIAFLYVMGYLDDYRTMDGSAVASFY